MQSSSFFWWCNSRHLFCDMRSFYTGSETFRTFFHPETSSDLNWLHALVSKQTSSRASLTRQSCNIIKSDSSPDCEFQYIFVGPVIRTEYYMHIHREFLTWLQSSHVLRNLFVVFIFNFVQWFLRYLVRRDELSPRHTFLYSHWLLLSSIFSLCYKIYLIRE